MSTMTTTTMTEQMHTPTAENTPWTVRRDDSGGEIGLWSVIDANGAVVFSGMEEGEARLFAAAPDMLEALKAALPKLEDNARFLRDIQASPGKTVAAFDAVKTVQAAIASASPAP